MLTPFPHHRRPGFPIAPASQEAAQLGNPVYRLAQGWGRLRRRGRPMDGAIQGLPFLQCQQRRTRHVRPGPAQHGRRENPPGNAALQRQTPLQPLGGLQLAGVEATATLQHAVPDFHAPATGLPVHPRERRCGDMNRPRGQQQPLDRVGPGGRRLFQRLHRQRHGGQPCALAMPGRAQGRNPAPPGGLSAAASPPAAGPGPWTWPPQAGPRRSARRALAGRHRAPRRPASAGPPRQAAPAPAGRRHRPPDRPRDHPGLRTLDPRRQDRRNARQPLLTVLPGHRALRAGGTLPRRWGRAPTPVGQQAQGPPLGGERQRGVHVQAAMGRVSQRSQARGGGRSGPVPCGGILHGQYQRDEGQAAERRVDMAVQEGCGSIAALSKTREAAVIVARSPHVGSDARAAAPGPWPIQPRAESAGDPQSASAHAVTDHMSSSGRERMLYSLVNILVLLAFSSLGYQQTQKTQKCG